MGQSLSKQYTHLIFHIKNSSHTPIRNEDKTKLYAYIGRIIKELDSTPILINGTENHIHIFCNVSKNLSISQLTKDIKRHSSRWIKSLDSYYINFSWQTGYGAFSVSPSLYEKTVKYIQGQEEHHKRTSFKEEYLLFLKEYNIEYNEEYIWED
ncbi:transposase [Bacteroides sp. 224]|uniref:transposase n=1 Tax=Bacteroides sp. 224 TaxID=2302936 RepID=UPI0013D1D063|nr:transposase [Bacteroides sp. 224]NDV64784.1 transposase [Bacteroides sp. 224]